MTVSKENWVRWKDGRGMRLVAQASWRTRLFAEGRLLPDSLVVSTQELKRTGSRRVRRLELADGALLVVKRSYPKRGFEGLHMPLCAAPAREKEWRLGHLLHQAGLPVAQPLAVGLRRRAFGLKHEVVLVLEQVPDAEDLWSALEGGRLRGVRKQRFARALGDLARRLHDAGAFLQDPHLGNFLLSFEGDEPHISPVDLRDTVWRPGASNTCRRHNLLLFYQTFGLLASRTERLRFLRGYLRGPLSSFWRAESRRLEQEGRQRLRRYHLARSRKALGENRGFTRLVAGGIRWHARRGMGERGLGELLASPESCFSAGCPLLKDGRTSTVAAKGAWVVKRDNYKRQRRRLLERWRLPRVLRAFRRGFQLELAGIRTPRVLAAGVLWRGPWLGRGYLVTERLLGARTLDQALFEASASGRQALIEKVARVAATLHERGFCHRDLKTANLLVDPRGEIWLVDLDGIFPRRRLRWQRREKDLRRLLRDLKERAALTLEEEACFRAAYKHHALREEGRLPAPGLGSGQASMAATPPRVRVPVPGGEPPGAAS